MESICSLIFQLSLGRPIPICDQAVYNYIISYVHPFNNLSYKTSHADGFTANMGTTIEAVKSGSGDLGALCKDNATELAKYTLNYQDYQPRISDDGIVLTPTNTPYAIVHQWDRCPTLKKLIEQKYGDE